MVRLHPPLGAPEGRRCLPDIAPAVQACERQAGRGCRQALPITGGDGGEQSIRLSVVFGRVRAHGASASGRTPQTLAAAAPGRPLPRSPTATVLASPTRAAALAVIAGLWHRARASARRAPEWGTRGATTHGARGPFMGCRAEHGRRTKLQLRCGSTAANYSNPQFPPPSRPPSPQLWSEDYPQSGVSAAHNMLMPKAH